MNHIAVILTSERCGHCRNMRGTGRLLSQNEIKKSDRQPNLPGGNYYDAKFMSKLILAGSKDSYFRVINIHYKTFNPQEGVIDISVFTLEDNKTDVRQTMLTEKNGKAHTSIYTIGENGKVVLSEDLPNNWSDLINSYVPVNMSNYTAFYPSLIAFDKDNWSNSIKNKTPIYGVHNGFPTKKEAPYGVITGESPNVMDFPAFLSQFTSGVKSLVESVAPETVPEERKVEEEKMVVNTSAKNNFLPSSGSNRFKYRLFVVEK